MTFYRKYSFKSKKPKLDPNAPGANLVDTVRAVSTLLVPSAEGSEASSSLSPTSDQALEPQVVATISREIAAALAQAHARAIEEADEDDYESGSDLGHGEGIGPKTSGIRGSGGRDPGRTSAEREREGLLPTVDEEEDEFPIPLRTRKGKEPVGVVGLKRKR